MNNRQHKVTHRDPKAHQNSVRYLLEAKYYEIGK